MQMTAVKSSNIKAIGHDPETKTLAVEFLNGNVYHYADVSAEKYHALLRADSIGGHLNAHIKGKHAHSKQGS